MQHEDLSVFWFFWCSHGGPWAAICALLRSRVASQRNLSFVFLSFMFWSAEFGIPGISPGLRGTLLLAKHAVRCLCICACCVLVNREWSRSKWMSCTTERESSVWKDYRNLQDFLANMFAWKNGYHLTTSLLHRWKCQNREKCCKLADKRVTILGWGFSHKATGMIPWVCFVGTADAVLSQRWNGIIALLFSLLEQIISSCVPSAESSRWRDCWRWNWGERCWNSHCYESASGHKAEESNGWGKQWLRTTGERAEGLNLLSIWWTPEVGPEKTMRVSQEESLVTRWHFTSHKLEELLFQSFCQGCFSLMCKFPSWSFGWS